VSSANYCLRGDLSDEMQVTDPNEDARLDRAIADASRVVDTFTRQEPGTFAPQTLTRLFDVPGSGLSTGVAGLGLANWRLITDNSKGWTQRLRVPPLISISSLSTDNDGDGVFETVWTSPTDYLLAPRNEETKRIIEVNQDHGRYGFPQGQNRIQIVGSWGIVEDGLTPFPIRRATLLLAMIYYRRPSNAPNSGGLGGAAIHIGYQDIDVAAILWEVAGRYRVPQLFA
jgi:hypothetical protein